MISAVAVALVALVCLIVFGLPTLSGDALNALVWGRDLVTGVDPAYEFGPTPHPLTNLVAGMATLGGREPGYVIVAVIALFALAALVVGAFRIGHEVASIPVGLVAAGFVATSSEFMLRGMTAVYDITALAFVAWALVLELRRPRRGVPVLVLLTLAGLIRPETWLLTFCYLVYLVAGRGPSALTWRARLGLIALAGAAPAIWLTIDLLVTGDPLFSLLHTRDLAGELGRDTGLANVPEAVVTGFRTILGAIVIAAASAGAVIAATSAERRLRFAPLGVVFVVGIASYLMIGVAGLSLIDRYLLPASLMLAVLAAFACVGWVGRRGVAARVWMVLGALLLIAYCARMPIRIDQLERVDAMVADRAEVNSDLSRLRDELAACRPVRLHQSLGLTPPLVAYHVGGAQDDYRVYTASARPGSYLKPASARVATMLRRVNESKLPRPVPSGAVRAAGNRSWEVYRAGC